MAEREHIEELHQRYLSLRENTPMEKRNGAECKAYHDWYDRAYVYFKSFDSLKDDSDFTIFVNAQKEGNCFVLAHIYDSISPSYKVLMIKTENPKDTNTATMPSKPYKIFISHSSKDVEFVNALVELLESIGFDPSNLFCSSVDGYGIGLSQDIFETLRGLFKVFNLYVIFVHSPNYYKSPVSLNEMGAAWVLKTDFCSLLTTNMDFGEMKGVVNGSTISIKVDNADAPARLTELKDHLVTLFDLKPIDSIKWERKRQAFLNTVLSIDYSIKDGADGSEQEETIRFNPSELELFSSWANNPVDQTYLVLRVRGGLQVHFGYRNGRVYSYGKEEAEFEDYMQRLERAGYIVVDRFDAKNRQNIYKITKQGYDFAKSLNS